MKRETSWTEENSVPKNRLKTVLQIVIPLALFLIACFILISSVKKNSATDSSGSSETLSASETSSVSVQTSVPTEKPATATPTSTPALTPTPAPTATPIVVSAPSEKDLIGCSPDLVYPDKSSWLDSYETRYVQSSIGGGIYLCYLPTGKTSFCLLEDGTTVTVLARQTGNSLVITESGDIGWCLSSMLVLPKEPAQTIRTNRMDPGNLYINMEFSSESGYYRCDYPSVSVTGDRNIANRINETFRQDEVEFRSQLNGREKDDIRLYRETTVHRLDSQILSVVYEDFFELSWSAHGTVSHLCRVFDVTTGKLLSLRDMAKDPGTVETTLLDWLLDECTGEKYADIFFIGDQRESVSRLLEDGSWYFDENGLTFVADTSSSISLSEGPLLFTKPYSDLNQLLKKDYLPDYDNFGGELSAAFPDNITGSFALIADDETSLNGKKIQLTADGVVTDLLVERVLNNENSADLSDSFPNGTLCAASVLRDGESILLYTYIPDFWPNLRVTYSNDTGDHRFYIYESLKDSSIIIIED